MTELSVVDLRVVLAKKTILSGLSFSVATGELFCLLGPTNSGKTTLLKTIAGIYPVQGGKMLFRGEDRTETAVGRRPVSLLFQSIALFPHLTGFDNLAFPLKRQNLTPGELRRRVGQIAELLRITHLLTRFPRTFSGGERQRVALGRAMIQPARLLLLDEPLSSLDARIRLELRNEFRRIHRQQEQTTIYVTHDPVEALGLADRVGILQEGSLVQVGSARGVYENPANEFIAQQLGLINLVRFEIIDSTSAVWLPDASVKLDNGNAVPPFSGGLLGVRPEWVSVSAAAKHETPWPATVETIEFSGHYSLVSLGIGSARLRARVTERLLLTKGKRVWIGLSRAPLYFESPQKV